MTNNRIEDPMAERAAARARRRDPDAKKAVEVKPLVERLSAGYRRHNLFPREGSLELNWRLGMTEAARQAFYIRRLLSFGLPQTNAQYSVLRDIYFSEGFQITQSELKRLRGVSSPNITKLIHGLERAGFVRRETNSLDKRSTRVCLTEAGIKFCESLVPQVGKDIERLSNCLSDAELAILNELLARLQSHIESTDASLND